MGPSKEELANYFRNNRKYFDDLANHFRQSDPEYYNQYIAPFYGSSFTAISSKKAGRPIIALIVGVFFLMTSGIIVFFVLQTTSKTDNTFDEEKVRNVNSENTDPEIEIKSGYQKMLDTMPAIKNLGDYEKGIMYYNLGDYKNAEKFLKKVPESSIMHKDAEEKLKDISKSGGSKTR
jgi:hypothetical protein